VTEHELLVLFGLPTGVLIILLVLRKRSPRLVWPVMLAVIAAAVWLVVLSSGGRATWPAASVGVGGSLLVMVWTVRRPFFEHRLSLQAFFGIPIYLLSLALVLAAGVGLGLLTP
jgi:hypothetical protein